MVDSRKQLLEKITEKFSICEEIYGIALFGRQVEGTADKFSDIDFILFSNDLAITQATHAEILTSIAPIISTYVIVCEERTLAQMCMLEGFSPYQKLDFSITDDMDAQKIFEPLEFIYFDKKLAGDSKTILSYDGNPRETLKNQLNDILFSIPRFAKCLFRKDRNLYRRWYGVIEHMNKILYEKNFGWNCVKKNLTPNQYQKLYDGVTPADEKQLQNILPIDQSPNISEGFRLAVQMIINIYKEKADAINELVDVGFAEYIYNFLEKEIREYQKSVCC